MNINGVEYVLVPKVATDEMVCAGYAHRLVSTRDAINAAIAAAPPVPAVVDEPACDRVNKRVFGAYVSDSYRKVALDWLHAWQAELGPALGLSVWQEPSEDECKLMESALARMKMRLDTSYGRDIFDCVHEVMGGGK